MEHSLSSVFDQPGLDEELVERVRAVREGLDVELAVGYLPAEADPGDWTLTAVLRFEGQPAGGFAWNWSEREPGVLYWTGADFSERLRGTRLFGPLAATLADFFDKRLGFTELYATAPSEGLKPILLAVGMVELERDQVRPGGEVRRVTQWGGRIDRDKMREHTRWRHGELPEPGWRSAGRTDPGADDLDI